MPTFSQHSLDQLATCHPALRLVCEDAIKVIDFRVLEGYRDEARQNDLFARGLSKLRFPMSNHNERPSRAVDLTPGKMIDGKWTIDWKDVGLFQRLAGAMFGVSQAKGTRLRWGGTWGDLGDPTAKFSDWGHFELLGE